MLTRLSAELVTDSSSSPPNVSTADDTSAARNNTSNSSTAVDDSLLSTVVKSALMLTIITTAVFGNALVVISAIHFRNLRTVANSFLVSLAVADLLVTVLVMPFSASQEISGKWPFDRITCDVFNANDVLFSTASLLHICCISMDRYIAITDPFHYQAKMSRRRVALMLTLVWSASSLLSHVPIHFGWYTTEEQQTSMEQNLDECSFKVNKVYAVVSSCISFWLPTIIMVFTYLKIYREALKQERQIHKMAATFASKSKEQPPRFRTTDASEGIRNHDTATRSLCATKAVSSVNGGVNHRAEISAQDDDIYSTGRKFKKEHRAARTLGIIMGTFLMCWLPFFSWYLITAMCEESCFTPPLLVSSLFWIGYTNSALNPIIYAFFNRDFKYAFRKLLFGGGCCCFCCRSGGGAERKYCRLVLSLQFSTCLRQDYERSVDTDAQVSGFTAEIPLGQQRTLQLNSDVASVYNGQ